ncbi:DMT family transporter [Lysobacter sp. HDW10]|uniref:DMT family transporter n=1 Tax=Lysobacter sp. HDW10 TaxID=2714936 RepID=UPI00140A1F9B|nr:DMT family transporter [Lysobacter sp. HDW10]QIK80449.1 DMT family transporter [Lysobacter sp. HDW10]
MDNQKQLGLRDIGLLMLVVVAWAFNFLTSAWAMREAAPFLFTAMRFGLLLIPMLFLMKLPPKNQRTRLIIVSLLIGVAHFGLSFLALHLAGQLTSPAIVTQSYVPMTVILGRFFLGEQFGWRTGLSIGVAFLGVLVLGLDPEVLANPVALYTMLVAAFMLAVATVLMKGLQGIDVWTQQGWMAALSIVPLLLISHFFESGQLAKLPDFTWRVWVGAAYSAFVSSLLGHGLYFALVKRHPVAQLMPWLLLVPVITALLGVFLWGDQPGVRVWLGGAMILGGVFYIALRRLARESS